jgi:two-component system chemotaxis response regulator CheY
MSNANVRQSGSRKRVRVALVVDDDTGYREMMSRTLRDAGYGVLEAADGSEALLTLLSEDTPKPTVIVLDLWMPRMSGPELLKVVRSYHRLSHIPVILTSEGDRYAGDFAKDAGWLSKPFEAEQLLALVDELCGSSNEDSEPRTG